MLSCRHPVVVFVNKSHRFAKRRRIRLAELEGEPMVLREVGSTTRLAFETAIREAGVTVEPVMAIGSREAVWLAVARGIGIGVVSDIEYMPHPDLHAVEVTDADIFTTAHVNCLAERHDARLISAFFDMAEELKTRRNVTFV